MLSSPLALAGDHFRGPCGVGTSATPSRRAGASRCSTRATSARPTSLCGKNGARSLVLIRNRDRTDRAPSNSPSSAGARCGGLGRSDWYCISAVIQPFLPLAYHSSASSLMNDDRVQQPSCTSQAPGPYIRVHYSHSFMCAPAVTHCGATRSRGAPDLAARRQLYCDPELPPYSLRARVAREH